MSSNLPAGIETFFQHCQGLQQQLVQGFEAFDAAHPFTAIKHTHHQLGQSRLMILEGGKVFDKSVVALSHIQGQRPPSSALPTLRKQLSGDIQYHAVGLSTISHPHNPFVPISHMNIRLFYAYNAEGDNYWWFGGGYDLTPCYGFKIDCIQWHRTIAEVCKPYGDAIYPEFKAWADRYFYIPCRREHRGIGGLFFDQLNRWSWPQCQSFTEAIGTSYAQIYPAIVARRQDTPFTEQHKTFQLHRRSRYVEFNLLNDRGTRFGLESGGNTDAILASMPPMASWLVDAEHLYGEQEQDLVDYYLKPRDWAMVD